MTFSLYAHLFLHEPHLPPIMPSPLTYVVAGNGVHLWAKREGLEVLIPLTSQSIHGLAPAEPFVRFDGLPRVSSLLVASMLAQGASARQQDGTPVETLFFLRPQDGVWTLFFPPQEQTPYSVRPVLRDDSDREDYSHVLIEVHTHPRMHAFFSSVDDAEETGFRVYAVLGDPHFDPASGHLVAEIRIRVVVYDPVHASYEFPASHLMELPSEVVECQPPSHVTLRREDDTHA